MKLMPGLCPIICRWSLPIWERGLKPLKVTVYLYRVQSLPIWERGLKRPEKPHVVIISVVAPYMGAWIETPATKHGVRCCIVAPYMGAWIETSLMERSAKVYGVAPYMGAWIETVLYYNILLNNTSLPIWERGLKRTGNDKLLVYIVLRGKMQIFYVEFGGGRLLWNMLLISMKNVHRL